jgi:hypothetical protein
LGATEGLVEIVPFPFLPTGAIVAAAVLFSAIAAFVAAMMAIDRAATRVFGGAVSSMVAGARRWRDGAARVAQVPSEELRPISAIALPAFVSTRVPAPVAPGRALYQGDPPASTWADEDVPPVEPLARVRPRMR